MSRSEVCADWITRAQLLAVCDATVEDALLDDCIKMASDVLFNFTRLRWPGACSDTVRPCATACSQPGSWAGWWASSDAIPPFAQPGQASARWPARPSCGCGWISEFRLPSRDVQSITEVKVDGMVLPASAYRLDDGYRLVRLGGDVWPSCQRLDLDDTEEGTWSITYAYDQGPPVGGENACKVLACQLALATKPDAVRDGRCRLPRRITSVTRQGVTMALIDPLTLFDEGKTGIAEVDLWVASVNRGDMTRPGTVIDPMRARSVRRTG